jgi:hypothetical protein
MSGDSIGAEDRVVIPTFDGEDIFDSTGRYDGHVRVEHYEQLGTKIYVDLFDSSIDLATKAHVDSEFFNYNVRGAKEATEFLSANGFKVELKIAR